MDYSQERTEEDECFTAGPKARHDRSTTMVEKATEGWNSVIGKPGDIVKDEENSRTQNTANSKGVLGVQLRKCVLRSSEERDQDVVRPSRRKSLDACDQSRVTVKLRKEGRFDNKFLCVRKLPQGMLGLTMQKICREEDEATNFTFRKQTWYCHKGDQPDRVTVMYTDEKFNKCPAADPAGNITLMDPPGEQAPITASDPRVFVQEQMGARVRLRPTVCPGIFLAYDSGERVLVRDTPCWWEQVPNGAVSCDKVDGSMEINSG